MNLAHYLDLVTSPLASANNLRVTDAQWQEWQDQLTVDLICGVTVGRSFAEYFNIQDLFLLFGNPPRSQVEQHIDHYYR